MGIALRDRAARIIDLDKMFISVNWQRNISTKRKMNLISYIYIHIYMKLEIFRHTKKSILLSMTTFFVMELQKLKKKIEN